MSHLQSALEDLDAVFAGAASSKALPLSRLSSAFQHLLLSRSGIATLRRALSDYLRLQDVAPLRSVAVLRMFTRVSVATALLQGRVTSALAICSLLAPPVDKDSAAASDGLIYGEREAPVASLPLVELATVAVLLDRSTDQLRFTADERAWLFEQARRSGASVGTDEDAASIAEALGAVARMQVEKHCSAARHAFHAETRTAMFKAAEDRAAYLLRLYASSPRHRLGEGDDRAAVGEASGVYYLGSRSSTFSSSTTDIAAASFSSSNEGSIGDDIACFDSALIFAAGCAREAGDNDGAETLLSMTGPAGLPGLSALQLSRAFSAQSDSAVPAQAALQPPLAFASKNGAVLQGMSVFSTSPLSAAAVGPGLFPRSPTSAPSLLASLEDIEVALVDAASTNDSAATAAVAAAIGVQDAVTAEIATAAPLQLASLVLAATAAFFSASTSQGADGGSYVDVPTAIALERRLEGLEAVISSAPSSAVFISAASSFGTFNPRTECERLSVPAALVSSFSATVASPEALFGFLFPVFSSAATHLAVIERLSAIVAKATTSSNAAGAAAALVEQKENLAQLSSLLRGLLTTAARLVCKVCCSQRNDHHHEAAVERFVVQGLIKSLSSPPSSGHVSSSPRLAAFGFQLISAVVVPALTSALVDKACALTAALLDRSAETSDAVSTGEEEQEQELLALLESVSGKRPSSVLVRVLPASSSEKVLSSAFTALNMSLTAAMQSLGSSAATSASSGAAGTTLLLHPSALALSSPAATPEARKAAIKRALVDALEQGWGSLAHAAAITLMLEGPESDHKAEGEESPASFVARRRPLLESLSGDASSSSSSASSQRVLASSSTASLKLLLPPSATPPVFSEKEGHADRALFLSPDEIRSREAEEREAKRELTGILRRGLASQQEQGHAGPVETSSTAARAATMVKALAASAIKAAATALVPSSPTTSNAASSAAAEALHAAAVLPPTANPAAATSLLIAAASLYSLRLRDEASLACVAAAALPFYTMNIAAVMMKQLPADDKRKGRPKSFLGSNAAITATFDRDDDDEDEEEEEENAGQKQQKNATKELKSRLVPTALQELCHSGLLWTMRAESLRRATAISAGGTTGRASMSVGGVLVGDRNAAAALSSAGGSSSSLLSSSSPASAFFESSVEALIKSAPLALSAAAMAALDPSFLSYLLARVVLPSTAGMISPSLASTVARRVRLQREAAAAGNQISAASSLSSGLLLGSRSASGSSIWRPLGDSLVRASEAWAPSSSAPDTLTALRASSVGTLLLSEPDLLEVASCCSALQQVITRNLHHRLHSYARWSSPSFSSASPMPLDAGDVLPWWLPASFLLDEVFALVFLKPLVARAAAEATIRAGKGLEEDDTIARAVREAINQQQQQLSQHQQNYLRSAANAAENVQQKLLAKKASANNVLGATAVPGGSAGVKTATVSLASLQPKKAPMTATVSLAAAATRKPAVAAAVPTGESVPLTAMTLKPLLVVAPPSLPPRAAAVLEKREPALDDSAAMSVEEVTRAAINSLAALSRTSSNSSMVTSSSSSSSSSASSSSSSLLSSAAPAAVAAPEGPSGSGSVGVGGGSYAARAVALTMTQQHLEHLQQVQKQKAAALAQQQSEPASSSAVAAPSTNAVKKPAVATTSISLAGALKAKSTSSTAATSSSTVATVAPSVATASNRRGSVDSVLPPLVVELDASRQVGWSAANPALETVVVEAPKSAETELVAVVPVAAPAASLAVALQESAAAPAPAKKVVSISLASAKATKQPGQQPAPSLSTNAVPPVPAAEAAAPLAAAATKDKDEDEHEEQTRETIIIMAVATNDGAPSSTTSLLPMDASAPPFLKTAPAASSSERDWKLPIEEMRSKEGKAKTVFANAPAQAAITFPLVAALKAGKSEDAEQSSAPAASPAPTPLLEEAQPAAAPPSVPVPPSTPTAPAHGGGLSLQRLRGHIRDLLASPQYNDSFAYASYTPAAAAPAAGVGMGMSMMARKQSAGSVDLILSPDATTAPAVAGAGTAGGATGSTIANTTATAAATGLPPRFVATTAKKAPAKAMTAMKTTGGHGQKGARPEGEAGDADDVNDSDAAADLMSPFSPSAATTLLWPASAVKGGSDDRTGATGTAAAVKSMVAQALEGRKELLQRLIADDPLFSSTAAAAQGQKSALGTPEQLMSVTPVSTTVKAKPPRTAATGEAAEGGEEDEEEEALFSPFSDGAVSRLLASRALNDSGVKASRPPQHITSPLPVKPLSFLSPGAGVLAAADLGPDYALDLGTTATTTSGCKQQKNKEGEEEKTTAGVSSSSSKGRAMPLPRRFNEILEGDGDDEDGDGDGQENRGVRGASPSAGAGERKTASFGLPASPASLSGLSPSSPGRRSISKLPGSPGSSAEAASPTSPRSATSKKSGKGSLLSGKGQAAAADLASGLGLRAVTVARDLNPFERAQLQLQVLGQRLDAVQAHAETLDESFGQTKASVVSMAADAMMARRSLKLKEMREKAEDLLASTTADSLALIQASANALTNSNDNNNE